MKEIGGYFGIEYSNVELNNFHIGALKLNSGRNCLAYLLETGNVKRIFVPFYICDVVIDTIIKYNVPYVYYGVDKNLEPIDLPELEKEDYLLYVNYFGLMDKCVAKLASKIDTLIIDNSQALFSMPESNAQTFYSLRKFVGVAEGAFLYTSFTKEIKAGRSEVTNEYLYTRVNTSARMGYEGFRANEHILDSLPINYMLPSTELFLRGYDFMKSKYIRERNFMLLHDALCSYNEFEIELSDVNGPLCYPFLSKNVGIREELIKNDIFVATYWPGMHTLLGSFEEYLQKHLLPLPIDQRYESVDMERILNVILLNKNIR